MTRRKKELFEIKKNKYGFPFILARIVLDTPIQTNKTTYSEIHISATVSHIELTLRGGSVAPISSSTFWDNTNKRVNSKTTLVKEIKSIIGAFKNGEIPDFLPKFVHITGGVLV